MLVPKTHPELADIQDTSDIFSNTDCLTVSVRTIVARCSKRNEAPVNAATITSKIS